MKKGVALLMVVMLVLGGLAVYAGPGPAPNAGDGIPDGSGFDSMPLGPFGPASNAGVAVSDGSGLDASYGVI